MLLMRFASYLLPAIVVALSINSACGQTYPNKPVRLVTVTPGNAQDFAARLIAQKLTISLGQQVIVENRGGGFIPAEVVSKAPPDGYTLLVAGTAIWIEPLLREKVPYDPVKDFAPITLALKTPSVLVVHPSLPVKSVKELIALAKSRPDELNSSSGPPDGSPHLAAELFKAMAGVRIVHIPYKGTAQALISLMGGEVQLSFPTAAAVTPYIKAGRLKALAVTSLQPSALLPGMPTIADSGLSGYEVVSITGVFAPAKTPAAIVDRLNQEIVRILNQPDSKDSFLKAGADVIGSTPDQLTETVKSEMTRMGKLIKDVGIHAE